MADEQNLIPSIRAAGKFVALNPFNLVVNEDTYYTVEAIRTIPEMQAMKLNLYELVFKPIGVLETDYATVLDRALQANAVIVSLTSRNNVPVYVISTYFKSFPLTDGVQYERMALIIDLGAVPATMAETLTLAQDEIKDYVEATIGVTTVVRVGSIPTSGYMSKEQSIIFENSRKSKITDTNNNVTRVKELETLLVARDARIAELEAALTGN